MKITIDKLPLLVALERIAPAAPRRATVPVLEFVHIAAGDGSINVTASNMDLFINDLVPCQVERPGECLAHFEDLRTIVKNTVDGAQLELTVEPASGKDQAGRLAIRADRATYELKTMDVDDFPKDQREIPQWGGPIGATELRRLIDCVSYAMSSEETRYYLCGIHLDTIDGNLRAEATDGRQLARAAIELPVGFEPFVKSVIVPAYVVRAIMALLSRAADDDQVELRVNENVALFEARDTQINARLIDGQYPDTDRVIPEASGRIIKVDKAHFLPALERMGAFAEVHKSGLKAIVFRPNGELCELASHKEGADAREVLEVEILSELEAFGCNPNYITEAASRVAGEDLRLDMGGADAPIRLEGDPPDGLVDVVHIIMPSRI